MERRDSWYVLGKGRHWYLGSRALYRMMRDDAGKVSKGLTAEGLIWGKAGSLGFVP